MKSILAGDRHVHFHLPDVFERKAFVEETDERSYGAACVVVFRFTEQQRRSAFDIPKINVVAEGCPCDLAGLRRGLARSIGASRGFA